MILRAFTLSDEHKNLLLEQKNQVLLSIDTIIEYLIENGDVTESWRNDLFNESTLNYFEVLPKGTRLMSRTIELEVLSPEFNQEGKTKVFRKDETLANFSLLSKVKRVLLHRQKKLQTMSSESEDENTRSLIDSHVQQIQNYLEECHFFKMSSQLLIAEVGALHHVENILSQIKKSINPETNIDFIKLINYLDEMKEVIKSHALATPSGARAKLSSRKEIAQTRQKFNILYNDISKLCNVLAKSGILPMMDETHPQKYLDEELRQAQQMFFTKNDINFSMA